MDNERTADVLQVALASYDRKELRVQKNYLEEQNPVLACTCFLNGHKLLQELQQGHNFDIVVLCSQMEDMSSIEFMMELRKLEHKPLLMLLEFFYSYAHNYGVAIILLTIVIKILFWPLSQKSYKSMQQMKQLQPLIVKIREKYADDKESMNREIMQLYKTYKVNPAGGCLPILIQIPVFFGLYQALLNAIELRHAPFISTLPFTNMPWLADLASPDPLLITPLVMGATMFLQQKMTPAPGDPTQAKVMMLMPLIFTVLFINFPSGLVVYWLINNVISIGQQWMQLRRTA